MRKSNSQHVGMCRQVGCDGQREKKKDHGELHSLTPQILRGPCWSLLVPGSIRNINRESVLAEGGDHPEKLKLKKQRWWQCGHGTHPPAQDMLLHRASQP